MEHTPSGELAKLREQLRRIEDLMCFRITVVERTGTSVKDLFSPTNIWAGSHCEIEDCMTCTQGAEDLPDCSKQCIVYEYLRYL